jgi:hypothetical protein
MRSILKVSEIQDPTNSNTAMTINSSGIVAPKVPVLSLGAWSGTQSISSGVWTAIDWSTHATVQADNTSTWDSANERWQPNVAGYYFCTLITSSGSGTIRAVGARVKKNGSAYVENAIWFVDESYGDDLTCTAQALIPMNGTTDYLSAEAYIYDSVVGSDNLLSYTRLDGFLVSAL